MIPYPKTFSYRQEASSPATAVCRALKSLRKEPSCKRKRMKQLNIKCMSLGSIENRKELVETQVFLTDKGAVSVPVYREQIPVSYDDAANKHLNKTFANLFK